jgi:hypothetical protein
MRLWAGVFFAGVPPMVTYVECKESGETFTSEEMADHMSPEDLHMWGLSTIIDIQTALRLNDDEMALWLLDAIQMVRMGEDQGEA